MGELIRFSRPDGQECPGYLATPAAGGDAPGIVVIQEWWGLNDQIRGVADRFAAAGYRALVPDLYRGRVAATPDEANHMMSGLDWGAATVQDVQGAVHHLGRGGRRVAVLGFCMGGALTLLAAAKVSGVTAGVCFYGIPPESACDFASIRVPLLLHFAEHDDWCNAAAVDQLAARLTAGRVPHDLHRYDAQHAFFNEQRPEVYDAATSKLAWDRSLQFLARELGA
ncbi:MAG: dienelactone hydrolase family protein [Candidatus Wallbacteria bacterium]|nr:dienelactone hydrolase family protein [Candidatus Wallbacteria bacterium]